MNLVTELSIADARRIALTAHGFGGPRPKPNASGITSVIAGLEALQLDSVNVFERSHYVPLFSRVGAYETAVADSILLEHAQHPSHIEYWAHVAAFIPVESWPLWRWKMDEYRDRHHTEGGWLAEHSAFAAEMLALVQAEGPLTASDIEHDRNTRTGAWWGWSDTKRALEYMFDAGILVSAGRRGFQRLYAAPDMVLPAAILDREIPRQDAISELVLRASTALGVGTESDIADYFRLPKRDTRAAIHKLVEAGELQRVTVESWTEPALMAPDTTAGAAISANTLLTPFDPVTWNRDRARRLFGFDYTIEIYVPAAKRQFGYYSLPVLMDEQLVARVDLKADRKTRTLIVRSAHWERERPTDARDRLVDAVRATAEWRGLESITVEEWGDASAELRDVLS